MSSYSSSSTSTRTETNSLGEYGDLEVEDSAVNKLSGVRLGDSSSINLTQTDRGAVGAAFASNRETVQAALSAVRQVSSEALQVAAVTSQGPDAAVSGEIIGLGRVAVIAIVVGIVAFTVLRK